MKLNRALVASAENIADSYRSKKSWKTCRALISIDDAAKKQADLLSDFARFVSEQGVDEIESSVLTSSLNIVFDKVCPGFALGCSVVLDSPELPQIVRDSVTAEMRAKIRDRVMYGPISDIAVAMNAEQAAKLMSIGFRRAGEYLFICRACTCSVCEREIIYSTHIKLQGISSNTNARTQQQVHPMRYLFLDSLEGETSL